MVHRINNSRLVFEVRRLLIRLILSYAVIAATCIPTCIGRSVKLAPQASKLRVLYPKALVKPNGYDHGDAVFGITPYGSYFHANVYYYNGSLCEVVGSTIDTSLLYPRNEKNPFISVTNNQQTERYDPFVILIDQDTICTDATQIRKVQDTGAIGVLVAARRCFELRDRDGKIVDNTDCCPSRRCATQVPLLTGISDYSIPSLLLQKNDGNKFKNILLSNQSIQIELSWTLPARDDRVEYELWTDLQQGEHISPSFYQDWKKVSQALGDRAYFTPHYKLYSGAKIMNPKPSLCTNNGRYCQVTPHFSQSGNATPGDGHTGADIVQETLRQLCIWNIYGTSNGIGASYWDYTVRRNTLCGENAFPSDNHTCLQMSYTQSGIDQNRVQSCMEDSGNPNRNVINVKLEKELQAFEQQQQHSYSITPLVTVNGIPLRESITVSNLFRAICIGYKEGSAPTVCNVCSQFPNIMTCIDTFPWSNTTTKANGGHISMSSYILFMILLITILSTGFMFVWKRTRYEIQHDVRALVYEYVPLEDNMT